MLGANGLDGTAIGCCGVLAVVLVVLVVVIVVGLAVVAVVGLVVEAVVTGAAPDCTVPAGESCPAGTTEPNHE